MRDRVIDGFMDEIEKLALSPAQRHALVTGIGAGSIGSVIGNVLNPSAAPGGERKSMTGQAVRGAAIGGASYLTGQALFDALKKAKI